MKRLGKNDNKCVKILIMKKIILAWIPAFARMTSQASLFVRNTDRDGFFAGYLGKRSAGYSQFVQKFKADRPDKYLKSVLMQQF